MLGTISSYPWRWRIWCSNGLSQGQDGLGLPARPSSLPDIISHGWWCLPCKARAGTGRRHLRPIAACSVLADAQAGCATCQSSGEKCSGVCGQYWKGTGTEGGAEPASAPVMPALQRGGGLEPHQGKLWRSRRAGTCLPGAQRGACTWLVHLLWLQLVGADSLAAEQRWPGLGGWLQAQQGLCLLQKDRRCPVPWEPRASPCLRPPRASVLPTQADTVAAALSTPLKSECASCPVGWKGPWLLETVLRNTFL